MSLLSTNGFKPFNLKLFKRGYTSTTDNFGKYDMKSMAMGSGLTVGMMLLYSFYKGRMDDSHSKHTPSA
ncbi:hypothetical protein K502DRAFT_325159, partial [Neoconidiobolus thromboides FSU 785]